MREDDLDVRVEAFVACDDEVGGGFVRFVGNLWPLFSFGRWMSKFEWSEPL